jgi:hypothetical protein
MRVTLPPSTLAILRAAARSFVQFVVWMSATLTPAFFAVELSTISVIWFVNSGRA